MKIEVIIPAKNAEAWIREAIISVGADCNRVISITVVDDGSSDRTVEVARITSGNITIIGGEGRGPSAARNRALRSSGAEFVVFLDADDYYLDGFVSAAIQQLTIEGADVAIGRHVIRRRDGTISKPSRVPAALDPHDVLEFVLAGNFFQTGAIVWRREFLTEIGGWREDMKLGEDVELLIRGVCRAKSIRALNSGILVYRDHASSARLTETSTTADMWDQYRASSALLREIAARGCDRCLWLFGRLQYGLAIQAALRGDAVLTHHALRMARDLRYDEHSGSIVKQYIERVLGVYAGARLYDRVRRIYALAFRRRS